MTDKKAPPGNAGGDTDELWPGGYRYFIDSAHFPLGMDSVLLAAFARVKRGMRVADLGTGCGYIPLMLLGWERMLTIDALEVVPSAAEIARRNVVLNKLGAYINVVVGDLREVRNDLPPGAYGLVVCNPPYFSPNSGAQSGSEAVRIARSGGCTVAEVCRAAAYLLKNGGSFCLCWKPERVAELFAALRDAGLEPKRMRLCESTPGQTPYLMLLDARKQAKPGLKMLPPLVIRGADGPYTPELLQMYHRRADG